MLRLIARTLRRFARYSRTAIRLGFSGVAWKIVLRHVISVARNRPVPETTKVATKIKEARGNLSTTMLFILGDFEAAREQALCDLESRPEDAEARMLVLGCAIELGEFECAEHHLNQLDVDRLPDHLSEQLPFFRYTLTRVNGSDDLELSFRHLDHLYLAMGCRPIRVDRTDNCDVFNSMTPVAKATSHCKDGYPPLRDGPLASVIMTAYNVEHLVQTSVMSILNQSYRNLELIVVDDCSTDGTLEALRLMEREDERIQVIAKEQNDGTYVSKNTGLLRAKGEFAAFQDSDDWSHPDRLGKSIAVLEAEPDIVALTTNWVRMTTDGDMILQNKNRYSYRACISLVVRREEVLQRSGFFDSVRAEGDAEFERRISLLFGEHRVVNYPWPLSFGRVRPGSITANAEFGLVRGRGRPIREQYRKVYKQWHEEIGHSHDGYMPFPLHDRPFDAPNEILPSSR